MKRAIKKPKQISLEQKRVIQHAERISRHNKWERWKIRRREYEQMLKHQREVHFSNFPNLTKLPVRLLSVAEDGYKSDRISAVIGYDGKVDAKISITEHSVMLINGEPVSVSLPELIQFLQTANHWLEEIQIMNKLIGK